AKRQRKARRLRWLVTLAEAHTGTSLELAGLIQAHCRAWLVAASASGADHEIVKLEPRDLHLLAQAAAVAQKIGNLSLNLPTELTAQAEQAEQGVKDVTPIGPHAPPTYQSALTGVLERIRTLDGDDFVRALEALAGDPARMLAVSEPDPVAAPGLTARVK
ncbi:MAG: hypothetical protein ACRDGM_03115, partial [bacterium]